MCFLLLDTECWEPREIERREMERQKRQNNLLTCSDYCFIYTFKRGPKICSEPLMAGWIKKDKQTCGYLPVRLICRLSKQQLLGPLNLFTPILVFRLQFQTRGKRKLSILQLIKLSQTAALSKMALGPGGRQLHTMPCIWQRFKTLIKLQSRSTAVREQGRQSGRKFPFAFQLVCSFISRSQTWGLDGGGVVCNGLSKLTANRPNKFGLALRILSPCAVKRRTLSKYHAEGSLSALCHWVWMIKKHHQESAGPSR